jgi:hypothetical protein
MAVGCADYFNIYFIAAVSRLNTGDSTRRDINGWEFLADFVAVERSSIAVNGLSELIGSRSSIFAIVFNSKD